MGSGTVSTAGGASAAPALGQAFDERRGYGPLSFEARVEAVGEEQLGVYGVSHYVLQVYYRLVHLADTRGDLFQVFIADRSYAFPCP